MAFSFDDWLNAHPADHETGTPPPLQGSQERGCSPTQTARWAIAGFDVSGIVTANLANDPLSGGTAWADSWAQGLAAHMAAQWGVALLERPLADHPRLAQGWRRLEQHPMAHRFITFARSNLNRALNEASFVEIERRMLHAEGDAGASGDGPARARPRL